MIVEDFQYSNRNRCKARLIPGLNSEVFVHVVVRSHEFRPGGDLALQQGDIRIA